MLTWPHTGAVLTGGTSSRMGARKGDLVLADGTTMATRCVRTMKSVCDQVVAVGRPLGALGHVSDMRSGTGPLGGIESLLKSGIDTEYLIGGIDTPLLTPELLRRLIGESSADATIFGIEGEPHVQSLPIRISASVADDVSSALDRGRYAIHQFLAEIDIEVVTVTKDQGAELANINSPADYARIAKE